MPKVLVLGANGMLGRALSETFRASGLKVLESTSAGSETSLRFRYGADSIESLLGCLDPGDFVLNGIGIISHRIDESQPSSRLDAIMANALLPYELGIAAKRREVKVLQIATDCVYSGAVGNYTELAAHDPLDVYGKSKSLGEVPIDSVMHLRCSIIGPEVGRNLSLFEWVRNQPQNGEIRGYADHFWNGVTTYAFANVALGIVNQGLFRHGVQHLVPRDSVSKYELVKLLAARAMREDITTIKWETGDPVNRTLSTTEPAINSDLWAAGGYERVPSIAELVAQMPLG